MNIKCPLAELSKLLLWEMATRRQCVFMPPPWLLEEPRALGKVLFLDCQLEWNVPEETPKACIPFLLPSLPLSPGHNPIPATPLCGGCFHHRWGDPKEGSWRWEPYHLETWSPGAFQTSSSPEAPRPLGAVGVVSVQEDPPGSGGHGLVQRGTGSPGPWGRACPIGWHVLPSSLSPKTVHPRDPRLGDYGSSPSH